MKLSFLLILIASALILSGDVSESGEPNLKSQEIRTDEHKTTIDKVQKTSENQPEKPTAFQTDLLEILRAIANQNKTVYEQGRADEKSWNSPSVWVNIGLLVVGLAYTVFACLQWRTINRQARIANIGLRTSHQAANAAQKSANISDSSLKTSQRAYLDVIFEDKYELKTDVPVVQFKILNTGPTRAKITWFKVDFYIGKDLPNRIDPPAEEVMKTKVIVPGQRWRTHRMGGARAFSTEEKDQIWNGDLTFAVYGMIIYYDIFNDRHFTRFCAVYDRRAFKDGQGFVSPIDDLELNDAD